VAVSFPKLNTLEMEMTKISHIKIKQPSFGEKRPKLTYTKISRFMVQHYVIKFVVNKCFIIPDSMRLQYHGQTYNLMAMFIVFEFPLPCFLQ
jgi:hypothetical protein